jgi:hypothetical protein
MRKKRTAKTKSKPPKRDQAWFERKVAELKAALERTRKRRSAQWCAPGVHAQPSIWPQSAGDHREPA